MSRQYYNFLLKGLEHPQMLVSTEHSGTNNPLTLRDDHSYFFFLGRIESMAYFLSPCLLEYAFILVSYLIDNLSGYVIKISK